MATSTRARVVRGVRFAALLAVCAVPLYLLAVRTLFAWQLPSDRNRHALVMLMGGAPPGWFGDSARRFAEADKIDKVDIAVIGSSHAYRSVDPREFEREGVRLFHIGSPYQTPVESDVVLRHYLPRMKPRLVLVEVFWKTLADDGYESLIDLVNNFPHSEHFLRMAWDVGRLEGINLTLGRLLAAPELSPVRQQRSIPGDVYIDGGFVETTIHRDAPTPPPVELKLSATQLGKLEQMIQFGKSNGAEVLLFMQPLPDETFVKNRAEIRATLHALAKRNGSDYLEFSGLDPKLHYADDNHTNKTGAVIFSGMLISALRSRGLLPAADGSDRTPK